MTVRIITHSSNRYEKLNYYFGTDLLKQYLMDNGFKCIVRNFTIHLYPPDDGFHYVNRKIVNTDFSKEIPEIYQLEPIIQVIQNYRNGDDLLSGIDKYFTDDEMENIHLLIDFIDKMKIEDGDVIGQQVLYLWLFHCVLSILRIKENHPDKNLKFVLGGYHITLSKITRDFLERFDFIDYLVINDGRQPLLDIVQGKTSSKVIYGNILPDISYPQYTRVDRYMRRKYHFQTISAFGCNNNCRFCASDRNHFLVDLNIIKDYLKEQDDLKEIVHINFTDDCINPTTQRLKDVSNMLIDLRKSIDNDFTWYSHFYAGNIDDESVELMKESGCSNTFIGAETFDDDILKIINKGCDSKKYKESISKINKEDIKVRAGIILNLPGETRERFMNTVNVLEELNHENLTITPTCFKLFPNSHIYKHPEKYGIVVKNWDQDIVDKLPETVGMKIPKEWYYIQKQDMTYKEKEEIVLKAAKLSENEKWEREVYKRGLFGKEVKRKKI